MATITKGGTLPDTGVTKNEVYALVDSATISGIVNADIASNAAIADTKLATISTAGKVATSAIDTGSGQSAVIATTSTYVFIVSGITVYPTVGATYTNNSKTFTVISSGGTVVYATGTGDPEDGGSLTKTGGTGDASISFSSVTGELPAVDGHKLLYAGRIVQVVNTQTGAVATGTTQMPYDDTIPQITEGDEYMTLAITPTSATNKLKIEIVGIFSHSTAGNRLSVALFQDTTAGALASIAQQRDSGVDIYPEVVSFTHYMAAGTTSETTFRLRAGVGAAGTTTFNGANGSRLHGGVLASSITITEIVA